MWWFGIQSVSPQNVGIKSFPTMAPQTATETLGEWRIIGQHVRRQESCQVIKKDTEIIPIVRHTSWVRSFLANSLLRKLLGCFHSGAQIASLNTVCGIWVTRSVAYKPWFHPQQKKTNRLQPTLALRFTEMEHYPSWTWTKSSWMAPYFIFHPF